MPIAFFLPGIENAYSNRFYTYFAKFAVLESHLNPDEFFEEFPHLLFASFRKQLLLGIIRAETVQTVLEPLLSNFYELMLKLPHDLQIDFENILRVYPDVAERFGLWIKPPLPAVLHELAEYVTSQASEPDSELDQAAEPQKPLFPPENYYSAEGQGFFLTDKGNPVFIEFSCTEQDDCASFEYKLPRLEIDLHICGIYAVTLSPQKPARKICVSDLGQLLKGCLQGVTIEIFEKPAGSYSVLG